ncbi:hypothetical protein VOLCADRAFT_98595 [Volvox carteri f. nagariensis]|uniref:Glycosyltransferase family 92 protein n=1 Tax=Volvox carteri f. nagariensis TaxID=3068 RepID=D8UFS0_VOLCA|nr:uncharacterized protein VOLCADRAFT_98595 [Volvox carteri f. nagariensis]EFJ41430.1 hypothetical protein VOLCADRAFT_98595 [Volvox carteri f. nagariensis]|eukprot:XP_002957536.1 hypothetical protein VOLCADRAFT_98595 [Volvox carteri f. nagariensis]
MTLLLKAWPHPIRGRDLLDASAISRTEFDTIPAWTPNPGRPSIPEAQHAPYEGSWKERTGYWMRRLSRQIEIGVYSELEEYLQSQQQQPDVNCHDALRNQSLPTSVQLGLAPWDTMKELETVPARIAFLNQLTEEVCSNSSGRLGSPSRPYVAAFGVWNGNMWGLRRSLLPWLQWSTHLGVCKFYIGYQGRDQQTLQWLRNISSVSIILISPPFAPEEEVRKWRQHAEVNEWAQKPGNWRLMAKQGYCGDIAIGRAKREGVQWLLHIDADELLMPAVSLAADLATVPMWAAAVKMHNHEALIESFQVHNKYEEVTLFKTHDATLPSKAGDLQWRFRLGTYPAYYQVYHNGKSIVRTDRAHVYMWGPHEFLGPVDDTWVHPEHNPKGEFKSVEGRTTLLHVSYASWHDLIGKARTSCPPKYRDYAVAGNRTKVKECFCLDFDLDAYMAAVQGEVAARDYWVITSLFSEGSVRKDGEKCKVYRDIERLKQLLIRDRLLLRVTGPQQA